MIYTTYDLKCLLKSLFFFFFSLYAGGALGYGSNLGHFA